MRAWARSNGYDVADRGRLPAELTDAYLAAQGEGGGKPAPARKAGPAKKAGAAKKSAPARKKAAAASKAPAARRVPVKVAAAPPAPVIEAAEPAPDLPAPKPSPVTEDRRLVALGEQLTALTERVAELEKSIGSKPGGKSGGMFRRSR